MPGPRAKSNFNRALILLISRRLDEALPDFDAMRRLNPDDSLAYTFRGYAKQAQGDLSLPTGTAANIRKPGGKVTNDRHDRGAKTPNRSGPRAVGCVDRLLPPGTIPAPTPQAPQWRVPRRRFRMSSRIPSVRSLACSVRLVLMIAAVAAVAFMPIGCGPAADNKANKGNADSNSSSGNHGGNTSSTAATAKAAAKKGRDFLMTLYNGDPMKGAWGPKGSVGASGLVLNALFRCPDPVSPKDEKVAATLDELLKVQESDGVWMSPAYGEAVYETAVVLRALVEACLADKDGFGKRDDVIAAITKGRDYLLLAQIDENPEFEGDTATTVDDPEAGVWYGGWGYGKVNKANRAAANMSTTHFAMDAVDSTTQVLKDNEKADAAREKLKNFLRHCHNLHEYNGQPYNTEGVAGRDERDPGEGKEKVMPANDGGAVYSPGRSKAGYDEGQGGVTIARSYGSMSYTLLKLYHMAGVPKNDMRVMKVTEWLTRARNFTFTQNPGMPAGREAAGQYYYLYTAAWALNSQFGNSVVKTDKEGDEHNWKEEITARISELQKADGSWVNDDSKEFGEQSPMVCTAYMMVALGYVD